VSCEQTATAEGRGPGPACRRASGGRGRVSAAWVTCGYTRSISGGRVSVIIISYKPGPPPIDVAGLPPESFGSYVRGFGVDGARSFTVAIGLVPGATES
jgi:hypothetical protein